MALQLLEVLKLEVETGRDSLDVPVGSSLDGHSDEDECNEVGEVVVVKADHTQDVGKEEEEEVVEHEGDWCQVVTQVDECLPAPLNSPEEAIQGVVVVSGDELSEDDEVDDAVGDHPLDVDFQVVDEHGSPEILTEDFFLGDLAEHTLLSWEFSLSRDDMPPDNDADEHGEAVDGKGGHVVDLMEDELVAKSKEGDSEDTVTKDEHVPEHLLVLVTVSDPVKEHVGHEVAEVSQEEGLLLWIQEDVVDVSENKLGWHDHSEEGEEVSLWVDEHEVDERENGIEHYKEGPLVSVLFL